MSLRLFLLLLAVPGTAGAAPQAFGPDQPVNSPDPVLGVRAGDVDGDGDDDVVYASVGSLWWVENQGGAFPGGRVQIPPTFVPLTEFDLGDLDGDGDLDAVVGSVSPGEIQWFENLGAGVFAAAENVTINSPGVFDLHAVDLDGDGDDDIVAGHEYGVDAYESLGGGAFASATTVDAPALGVGGFTGNVRLGFGDFDGDGLVDVVVSYDTPGETVTVKTAPAFTFGARTPLNVPTPIYALTAARDESTGSVHVFYSWDASFLGSTTNKIELGPGGASTSSGFFSSNAGYVPHSLELLDFDGDGALDLLSAGETTSSGLDGVVYLYRSAATPLFSTLLGAFPTFGASSIAVGEVSGDAFPDLIVGRNTALVTVGYVTWNENAFADCNGNGTRDRSEIADGTATDCDANGVPDGCQLAADPDLDLNTNGVLDPCEALGTPLCSPSIPNSTGAPGRIRALGPPLVFFNSLTLVAEDLPPNTFGFFLVSDSQGTTFPVPNSQGRLCLVGSIGRFVGPGQIVNSGSAGRSTLAVDLTALPIPTGLVSVQPGETWSFQYWHRDTNPGPTSNFTDGVAVTLQ